LNPRGLIVDLDGTLYRAGPVKVAMAAELVLFGLPVARLLRAFRAQHEHLRADPTAPLGDPFSQQLARTARLVGTEPAILERVVRDWMVERPGKWLRLARRADLLVALGRYRSAGGRTALVSDYPAREKLAALGASHLFEVVVASGEPGGPQRLKPAPDGFLAAAASLSLAPAECLAIGDRDDADGEAARRAGMAFQHVDGAARLVAALCGAR
jgi:FMN phosphatase YigB (HAD superfamily)